MLVHRPRRLRRTPAIRNLIRETTLSRDDFILPLFVSAKIDEAREIKTMPGVHQHSWRQIGEAAASAYQAGVQTVLLFGIPEGKDARASGAYAADGVIQRAICEIKTRLPELTVITDVCLCEYMDHGHCGVVRRNASQFEIRNDETVELLAKTAVSHAMAGADLVAPSDMMDGRIAACRTALDQAGFEQTGIISYAAKFASAFYGPFRDAAESPPQFGDRRSYQMDPANAEEALREVELDLAEGADIVLIKPAMPYLDIVWRVRERFGRPTGVYHVSGEFAMMMAAVEKGTLDRRSAILEVMTSLKRAGADFIITYWARELMEWLSG